MLKSALSVTALFPASTPANFVFEPPHAVRVLVDNRGEPWFFAKDVCVVVGYEEIERTLSEVCRWLGILKCADIAGRRSAEPIETVIDEGNPYPLTSRAGRPNGERLESWVRDEALPLLCKQGGLPIPIRPQEMVTRQYTQLVRDTDSIKSRFWFGDAARRALYVRIRAVFNITHIDQLSATELERALHVPAELEPSVDRYVNERSRDEARFSAPRQIHPNCSEKKRGNGA